MADQTTDGRKLRFLTVIDEFTLAALGMTLDAPGMANCASFDTTTIRESPVPGYPRLLWRTDCKADRLRARERRAKHAAESHGAWARRPFSRDEELAIRGVDPPLRARLRL